MKIIRIFLLVFIVATLLFLIFIYLEKNNTTLSWHLKNKKQLNPQSIELLKSFKGEKAIKFEIFARSSSVVAKNIAAFLKPYKNLNTEIIFEFIDPTNKPSLAKQYAITMQGEMVVSFQNDELNYANISELSESALMNALLQLQRREDKWLIFAQGYGMRTIEDESPNGLSDLLIYLKKSGVHIARMPLSPLLELPENVKVILLPAPTDELDAEIVTWLEKQINNGISLWWLADIDSNQQRNLELATNIMLGDKTSIIKDSYVAAISEFPIDKITENFNQAVLFAESKELISTDAKAIVKTEFGKNLALAKQLSHSRLFITGDVDFISNQYLKVAANKNFILRVIDWLFYHDDRINIALQSNNNTQLYLTQRQLIAISVVFLLLFPLFYLIFAVINFRRRNGK